MFGAIAAVVAHAVWGFFSLAGTVATFADCTTSGAACAGGIVGLLALGAGAVGVAAAVAVLRKRSRGRGIATAWISFAAAFVLLIVMAGFDGAFTR